jgi:hypothetical protein
VEEKILLRILSEDDGKLLLCCADDKFIWISKSLHCFRKNGLELSNKKKRIYVFWYFQTTCARTIDKQLISKKSFVCQLKKVVFHSTQISTDRIAMQVCENKTSVVYQPHIYF